MIQTVADYSVLELPCRFGEPQCEYTALGMGETTDTVVATGGCLHHVRYRNICPSVGRVFHPVEGTSGPKVFDGLGVLVLSEGKFRLEKPDIIPRVVS